MKMYHGSDAKVETLKAGSYVTRNLKDAWKFGYRRAVANGSGIIYVYEVDVGEDEIKRDNNRDRAFITAKDVQATFLASARTFSAPYKLKRFTPET